MEQRPSEKEVVVSSSNAPRDRLLPWPRYPSCMAATELPVMQAPIQLLTDLAFVLKTPDTKEPTFDQVNVSYQLLECIRRCEAAKLEAWPLFTSLATAMAASLQAASVQLDPAGSNSKAFAPKAVKGHGHGNQQTSDLRSNTSNTQHIVTLQPWALAPATQQVEANSVPDQRAQDCRTTAKLNAPAAYGDMTFSGRMRTGLHGVSNARKKEATLPPMSIATAGAPLFRFIAFDTLKLEMSDKAGSGGGMYHVKQPEWNNMVLTSGRLQELHECLSCWHDTRVMANLPVAKLQADVSSHAGHWTVQLDQGFSAFYAASNHAHGSPSRLPGLESQTIRPCSNGNCAEGCGRHCLGCVMQQLAAWLPAQLLADPVQTLNTGTPSQVPPSSMPWLSATLSLRWWSAGAVEPLKYSNADKLLLQVCGSTRILLVPPSFAFQGLAPFPIAHPYHGYSAPGIAISSRPPMPACNATTKHKDGPHDVGNTETDNADTDARSDHSTHDSSSAVQAHAAVKPAAEPSPAYLADEVHMCEAVAQLWPDFLNVRGHVTVLRAGDAVWIPAGWFVHLETLYSTHRHDQPTELTKAEDSRTISTPAVQPVDKTQKCGTCGTPLLCSSGDSSNVAKSGCVGSPNQAQAQLPANAMLEVELGNGVLGTTPRALGALQLRCANIIEEWAKTVTGSEVKVRPLLLDMADRLEAAMIPGVDCYQEEPITATGRQTCNGTNTQQVQTTSNPTRSKKHAWVSFPGTANNTPDSSELVLAAGIQFNDSANFQPRHWAMTAHNDNATTSSIDPCWDVTTLAGYKTVAFAARVMKLLAPLSALEDIEYSRIADVKPDRHADSIDDVDCDRAPNSVGNDSWLVGRGAARFLRAMCRNRLLPTTWLNKLMNNDLLLLKDVPYKYTLEYRDEDEAQFPELFAPQLERREKAARAAAREAHIAKLRLMSNPHGKPPLLPAAETSAS